MIKVSRLDQVKADAERITLRRIKEYEERQAEKKSESEVSKAPVVEAPKSNKK